MRVQVQSTGSDISLDPRKVLGRGGEATIYSVPEMRCAAKLYHQPSPERAQKLTVMLANPPVLTAAFQRVAIAWPVDLILRRRSGEVLGFLMPRVANMRSIADVYNPRTRKQCCPAFTYLYLLRTAFNLAVAFQAVHERGYLIGDVNESNVLVGDTALVTLVDTDSFQVSDRGLILRCRVGKPEFTPPELQGRSFADVDRSIEHDRFGLAILIFHLL